MSNSLDPPQDLVSMGKILKPRGLKGEIWITIFNAVNSSLKIGTKVWLFNQDGKYSSKIIEKIKISSKKSWIKFEDCHSRQEIHGILGLFFSISRSEFNLLTEDEIYLVDLIGSIVFDENKIEIGLVVDTMKLPSQTVVVVEADKGEMLIPYVDAHIMLFDNNRKHLIVKNVEGLYS